MALDRACVAYEQPAEFTHCLNLGTRREEEQRAAEGDMEKNCRRREAEDGVCHLERSCYRYKRQSGLEETGQRPYSLRGDVGNKSIKSIDVRKNLQTKPSNEYSLLISKHAFKMVKIVHKTFSMMKLETEFHLEPRTERN